MKAFFTVVMVLVTISGLSQVANYQRVWATYYGGESTVVTDDAIDSEGNVYIAGYMKGDAAYLNSFVSANAFQTNFGGGETDGFIAKFSPDGLLLWSTFFGGAENDRINAIVISGENQIFVAGQTNSAGLSTVGAFQPNIAGLEDSFIAEFDTQGSRMWCTYFGGVYNDSIRGMTCDSFGNLFVFGKTSSPSGITTSDGFEPIFVATPETSPEADDKNFIARFSENGIQTWGTYYGSNTGNSRSIITGIATSIAGVYVSGFVLDSEMNSYFATVNCHQNYNSNAAGLGVDMFLTQFSAAGSRNWSTYYGGTSTEKSHLGSSLFPNFRNVVATRDFVYISGITGSNNNMSTPGVFQTSKQGQSNFVAKFNDVGVRQWGTYLGNTSSNGGTAGGESGLYTILSLDENADIIVSGSTPMTDVATANGYQTNIPLNPFGLIEGGDSFMTKISKDGSSKLYGTYYGGDKPDGGCATLSSGTDFYMVGNTQSSSNIATTTSFQNSLNGNPASTSPDFPTNAFIVKFAPILSTTEFFNASSVIYPVPNDGNFNINLNANYLNSEIKIYDITGKNVYSGLMQSLSQRIEAKNLSSRTYILKISNGNGLRYERKFIVR